MASDGLEVVRERRVQAQPSAARMLADIEAIVGLGIRRPGYPADRQAEEWAARRFTELGARDQIVVEPLTLIDLPQSLMRDAATFSFDPDGEFDPLVQTLPFGPGFNRVADAAVEAGAAGYVGILTGFPWETADYFVPYDARSGGGPAPQPDVPAHGRAYGGGSGHAVLRGPARRQPGQRRPRGASGARGRAGAR